MPSASCGMYVLAFAKYRASESIPQGEAADRTIPRAVTQSIGETRKDLIQYVEDTVGAELLHPRIGDRDGGTGSSRSSGDDDEGGGGGSSGSGGNGLGQWKMKILL